MSSQEIKIGSEVFVPKVRGNISWLKRTGRVIKLMGDYCTVFIKYGPQTGYWTGRVEDVKYLPVQKKKNIELTITVLIP